ncbi:predicted protein [Naegleria gruberi]|uniref:Predicted protein n=1 Tax=Naegleria gruberi TaxID=5762 RepID=D2VWW8_NAEGR|nr:uncharacterized protein NAEGRDRAFT_73531 [Naegleria gruberi]EFC38762.1 predicted protein [Naegleria gruberi]|eukprot:XP_002671506.1 predicted protein [Naegleria gruberi strain NEG-M]
MKIDETQKVFDYIELLGELVCFPRRVLIELDGLKNDNALRKKIVALQQITDSLGSLRHNEPVEDVQKYIRSMLVGDITWDEEIILTAKYLKENVCINNNVKLLSNDYGVHTLSNTYDVQVLHLNELKEITK